MKSNKYNQLINLLLKSTRDNRVSWSRTSRQNEYTSDVLNYSITITKLSQSTFSISNGISDKFAISLINENGDNIDIQEVLSSDADYSLIASLYAEARRSYFKVDEVLDTLIDNLN